MSKARTTKQLALAFAATAVLAACGGGGDPATFTVTPTASGIWKGSTDAGRAVTAVVLEDGSYYMIYSGAADAASVAGGVQGSGSLTESTFASASGLNYNFEGAGVQPATLSASLQPFSTLVGNVTNATSGSFGFQTSYSADSRNTPSLATLAGDYPGQVTFALGVRPAVFAVTATGQVSTVINACTITGTVAPRTDINAYDLTIVFGGAPCVFPNASFSGVAYHDVAAGKLSAFVRHATVPQAIFFTGSRS